VKPADIAVPHGDGEILIVPAASGLCALVKANPEGIGAYEFEIAGRPIGALRDAARAEAMKAAADYTASLGVKAAAWDGRPIVMTGHQPEFYHSGVWVKNHLAAALARAVRGVGLNLVVDNDVPREGELTFPVRAHGGFARHGVYFAEVDSATAHEEHTDKSSWQFDHLAGDVIDLLALNHEAPLIARFMEGAADCMERATDLAHMMTLLRRRYEDTLGLANLELPASMMSETKAFALFVLAVAADAERFTKLYNAALAEYRRVNGIRNENHPMPDARVEAGRIELPFWAWRPLGPRRRLWVRGAPPALMMDDEPVFEFPEKEWQALRAGDAKAFDAAAARLVADRSFKVRPRAISNTLFCRVLLSDVFIHGVGGARYDTITDEIIRQYLGVEPPAFITSSATLFLPIDVEAARRGDIARLKRELRDCRFNAERHMDDDLRRSERVEELVNEKRELVRRNRKLRGETDAADRARRRLERREIFQAVRRVNQELASLIAEKAAAVAEELARIEHHAGDEDVVKQRGYAFVLYPEKQLLDFYRGIHIG
jgi:hypothetical protein